MGKVSFLFADDSYEVAQILDNKTIIVFAHRIDINSGIGSIFLTSLNIEDSDDGVIRGNLRPFTTNRNIARRLSSRLNDYLNNETNESPWHPEGYNPNTDWDAKFSATEIENDQYSGYGVVWENIPTPNWENTSNLNWGIGQNWEGTPNASTVIAIRLNELFDFCRERPNIFTINSDIIHSECKVIQFGGR
jgi:hypothetical protein